MLTAGRSQVVLVACANDSRLCGSGNDIAGARRGSGY